MKHNREQIKVMELLAKNEEIVSQLYELFKKKFPAYRKFWNSLSKEELIHAGWIKKIYPEVESGKFTFNKDRFSIKLIQNSIDYVADKIVKFKRKHLSFREALEAALEIEITFPESKFYEVYDTDSKKLKRLLTALRDAFEKHRDKLLDVMQEDKSIA